MQRIHIRRFARRTKSSANLYKSEHMRNAGPYARLKFAMDYWCALWFWPIDQADLLPTRSEFLFDMSLILEGTMASVNVTDSVKGGQLSVSNRNGTDGNGYYRHIRYGYYRGYSSSASGKSETGSGCKNCRTEQVHALGFEFADLFAERGGFDLIIGNPPWIKAKWDEQSVLADFNPLFTIRDFPVNKKNLIWANTLKLKDVFILYLSEYTQAAGTLNYMNANRELFWSTRSTDKPL